MKLLKPKRKEMVKVEYEVLKPTRLIFDLYSKYTNYTEGEILDHLAIEVLKEDYDLVVKAIEEGYKRFATGTYAIWYPVVLRQQTKRIFKGLEATGIRKILKIELAVRPDSDQRGMTASGMVVINPPWQLEQQMKSILPYLTQTLVPEGTGSWTVEWIVPE